MTVARVEKLFQLLEACGYPKGAADWLRRRRLLVIAALAVLSWLVLLAIGSAVVFLFFEFADLFHDLTDSGPRPLPLGLSTPR